MDIVGCTRSGIIGARDKDKKEKYDIGSIKV